MAVWVSGGMASFKSLKNTMIKIKYGWEISITYSVSARSSRGGSSRSWTSTVCTDFGVTKSEIFVGSRSVLWPNFGVHRRARAVSIGDIG